MIPHISLYIASVTRLFIIYKRKSTLQFKAAIVQKTKQQQHESYPFFNNKSVGSNGPIHYTLQSGINIHLEITLDHSAWDSAQKTVEKHLLNVIIQASMYGRCGKKMASAFLYLRCKCAFLRALMRRYRCRQL